MISFIKSLLVTPRVLNDTESNSNDAPSNITSIASSDTISASKIAESVNQSIMALYGNFLNEDGTSVDYAGMVNSPDFATFERSTTVLTKVDLGELPENEKKPFFINLYNGCLIHAYVRMGVPTTTIGRLKLFSEACYRIGPFTFSLDDIEHGVLRGNAKNPITAEPQFSETDIRVSCKVQQVDPRIHFALVCGAKSCPPIRIYTSDNCERALHLAALNFCQNNIVIKDEVVELSQIYKWYTQDFSNDQIGLLKYVRQYLSNNTQLQIDKLLENPSTIKFVYIDYDWSINTHKM